eukprot:1158017-Pelagomonas_calceolata.AAC.4
MCCPDKARAGSQDCGGCITESPAAWQHGGGQAAGSKEHKAAKQGVSIGECSDVAHLSSRQCTSSSIHSAAYLALPAPSHNGSTSVLFQAVSHDLPPFFSSGPDSSDVQIERRTGSHTVGLIGLALHVPNPFCPLKHHFISASIVPLSTPPLSDLFIDLIKGFSLVTRAQSYNDLAKRLGLSREDLDRTKQQLQQLRESERLLRVQLQEAAATNAQLQRPAPVPRPIEARPVVCVLVRSHSLMIWLSKQGATLNGFPSRCFPPVLLIACCACTQGTVSGQHDKLLEVESALATLRTEASQREKAATALEADLRAQLKEAEETKVTHAVMWGASIRQGPCYSLCFYSGFQRSNRGLNVGLCGIMACVRGWLQSCISAWRIIN